MLGKTEGRRRGMAEDETVRQHHWLNGHESEQTLGDSVGQRSLVGYSSWGRKELDTTQWGNDGNFHLKSVLLSCIFQKLCSSQLSCSITGIKLFMPHSFNVCSTCSGVSILVPNVGNLCSFSLDQSKYRGVLNFVDAFQETVFDFIHFPYRLLSCSLITLSFRFLPFFHMTLCSCRFFMSLILNSSFPTWAPRLEVSLWTLLWLYPIRCILYDEFLFPL